MSPERLAVLIPRRVLVLIALVPIALVAIYLAFGETFYISLMSLVSIAMPFLLFGAAVFCIGLVIDENNLAKQRGVALGWRRLTFTRVICVLVVAAEIFSWYVAITQIAYYLQIETFDWAPAVTATVFVAIESIPLLAAAYLALIQRLHD